MEYYFAKFPTIIYDEKECTDITRKVKFTEETKNELTLFYTHEVKNGRRADLISHAYYDDPALDWYLYITNEIVDPYYQWSMSQRDFEQFLIKKYGSVEASQEKIAFYRNNWYNDTQQITDSHYNNVLPNSWKKYYEPVYGPKSSVLAWKRREQDWTVETNRIWKLTCANNSNSFTVGELVDVANSTLVRVGGGEVTATTNTYILIKHVDGEFANNYVVTGETSEANATVSNTELVYEAISNSEAVFWSPVYYYEIEEEKNAYNRTIKIIDNSYTLDLMEQLRTLLRE